MPKSQGEKTIILTVFFLLATLYLLGRSESRFPGIRPAGPGETILLFAGDIMLDREIRRMGEEKGYSKLFGEVSDIVGEAHFAVGNLEGPVTDRRSLSLNSRISEPGNTIFTMSPEALGALKEIGFDILSIGNNHIYDFGTFGLDETTRRLEGSGIDYFGDPRPDGKKTEVIVHRRNFIGLINYNQFLGSAEEVFKEVEKMKKEGLLPIVYAHWGEEYQKTQPESVRALGRAFVDAGADLVVGTHPHVIGETEFYSGVPIYYSLGNFIFDQWWSDEVREGLLLVVRVKENRITDIDEFMVENRRDIPAVILK